MKGLRKEQRKKTCVLFLTFDVLICCLCPPSIHLLWLSCGNIGQLKSLWQFSLVMKSETWDSSWISFHLDSPRIPQILPPQILWPTQFSPSLWYPYLHLSSERLHSPLPGVLASTPFPPIQCTSCSQSGVLCSADVSILFNSFWWLHIRINFTEHKLSALYCGRSLFVWQRFKIQTTYILTLWSQAVT